MRRTPKVQGIASHLCQSLLRSQGPSTPYLTPRGVHVLFRYCPRYVHFCPIRLGIESVCNRSRSKLAMMNSVRIALLSGLSLVVFTALRAGEDRRPPTASKSRAGQATFASICGNCHGANGEGRTDLKTPSIAALPYWYVETQLDKFRQSVRGGRPDDTGGRLMHAVAQTLSKAQAKEVAGFVSELTRRPTRRMLESIAPLMPGCA